MYTLVQFNNVAIPPYNKSGQFPTAPARRTEIRVVGGSYDDEPDQQVFDFPYTLQWQSIAADDSPGALRAQVDPMRAEVGRRGLLWRKNSDDGGYQFAEAKLQNVFPAESHTAHHHIPINYQWLIHSHWYGGQIGEGWALDTGEVLDSGLFLDVTSGAVDMTGSPTPLSIDYGGDLSNVDIQARIVNGTGASPITALTLSLGDADLDWAGSLAAGAELLIDAGAWSVTNAGVYDPGLSVGAAHALQTWLQIDPGINTGQIVYTGGTGGSTDPEITISLYELFA